MDEANTTKQQADGALNTRHTIRSLRARQDAKRTWVEKFADRMSDIFGSVTFLAVNVTIFAAWIVLNLGIIPGFVPFDPFPFGFLTMAVSLEAIILSIIVLVSQNRAEKIAELREEIDLQVDLITEEQLTKLLRMVSLLLEKHGIDPTKDVDLQQMKLPTEIDQLENILEEEVINKRT